MKKKATLVNQPGKTETNKSEPIPRQITGHIVHHHHSFCEHSHGRVNRHPFGGSNGPAAF